MVESKFQLLFPHGRFHPAEALRGHVPHPGTQYQTGTRLAINAPPPRLSFHHLHSLRPFTSKDCDIWVSPQARTEIRKTESSRLVQGVTPAEGQLGILILQQAPLRIVDFMSGIYGVRQQELARFCERAPVFSDIKVIDPIFLFRSKCHCLLRLDQSDRHDERHVRMMALVLPEYLSFYSLLSVPIRAIRGQKFFEIGRLSLAAGTLQRCQ